MIKGVQLLFNLILYFHLKGCLWYFVCVDAKIWNTPSDWKLYSVPTSIHRMQFYNDELTTPSMRYWMSFYTSVIMIKGNEIGPRSQIEIVVCSFILIFDLIVAGNIFGNVSVLVQMSNRKAQSFQSQIDTANGSMKNMKIPK